MAWWIWAVFGLVLLGAELISPGGFYLLFFGIGALFIALFVGLELIEPIWEQWLLFSAISILALAIFRRPLLEKIKPLLKGKEVDNLVGEAATATEEIAAGGVGKVELRGASWSARNIGPTTIGKGQRLIVDGIHGLTLSVRAEK
ncbi:MAG TPA: NfeD family protein [Bdellovibrionota bacterium]|nr:NfeD family protein [Bdellovibrionota bacterium]